MPALPGGLMGRVFAVKLLRAKVWHSLYSETTLRNVCMIQLLSAEIPIGDSEVSDISALQTFQVFHEKFVYGAHQNGQVVDNYICLLCTITRRRDLL